MRETTLISGASGDIGRACALALARRGDRIAVHCHTHRDAAEALVQAIRSEGGTAESFRADLTQPEEVRALHREVEQALGTVTVLINNAGLAGVAQFQDIEECDWNRVVDANLKSAYLLTRAVLPGMIAQKSGCIVNIASMWGQVGASCEAHYSAAKGGLIAMTKALAKEVGPSGIRVNGIAPGVIETDMIKDLGREARDALKNETPLRRLGLPGDVAGAVLFLTGPDASFITGQVLGVNGGFVM